MRHEESQIQAQVVRWLQLQYPNCLFTGGFAGELMNIQRAIRRKQMGYRKGSPDLIIFEARQGHHGLCVELKSVNGILSESQIEFQTAAEIRGYRYTVCHSLADSQKVIGDYLA